MEARVCVVVSRGRLQVAYYMVSFLCWFWGWVRVRVDMHEAVWPKAGRPELVCSYSMFPARLRLFPPVLQPWFAVGCGVLIPQTAKRSSARGCVHNMVGVVESSCDVSDEAPVLYLVNGTFKVEEN